jgi:chromosomal replication initiation ATPase DnaA
MLKKLHTPKKIIMVISPYIAPGVKKINEQDIIDAVCDYFEMDKKVLFERGNDIAPQRQIAMYIIRMETKLGVVEVGKLFNKHHTTVTFSVNRINELLSIKEEETTLALKIIYHTLNLNM